MSEPRPPDIRAFAADLRTKRKVDRAKLRAAVRRFVYARAKAERDAAGTSRVCTWCLVPVKPPRLSWCSDTCYRALSEWTHGGTQRYVVAMRDRGVCALCHVDTTKAKRTSYILAAEWDADHTIPLAEGGDDHPSNMRTLCVPCHRSETKALHARLAAVRGLMSMEHRAKHGPGPSLETIDGWLAEGTGARDG